MKKKLVSTILTASLALTLTACDGPNISVMDSIRDAEQSSYEASKNSASASDTHDSTDEDNSSQSPEPAQNGSINIEVINPNEVNIVVKTDFIKKWGENKSVYLAFWNGEPGPDTNEILICRLDQNQKSVMIPDGDYSEADFDVFEEYPDAEVSFNVNYTGVEQLLRSSGYIWLHTEDYTGEGPMAEDLLQISDPSKIASLFSGTSSGSPSDASSSSETSSSAPETGSPSSSSSSGTTTPSSGESPASDFEYGIADGQMNIYRYIGRGGKVVVPSHIDGKPVEVVSGNTFYEITNVTSVVLPDTVTELGSAFESCTGLQSVKLPSKITALRNDTFNGCKNLTSVEIPNGVTYIGSAVFADCTSLTDIKIPASASEIAVNAFDNTPWKTARLQRDKFLIINNMLLDAADQDGDITVPDGVTTIVFCVPSIYFENAIILPDSVTRIRNAAFGAMSARVIYKGKTYGMTNGEVESLYNYY